MALTTVVAPPPARINIAVVYSAEEEEAEGQKINSHAHERSRLSFVWTAFWSVLGYSSLPRQLSPRNLVENFRCSPRSYCMQLHAISHHHGDPRIMRAFLVKSIYSLPLETLTSSPYFWTFQNLQTVCELLATQPEKFRALLRLTPRENFILYPSLCQAEQQAQIMLEVAYGDENKLKDITDIILTLFGDTRNGEDLDDLYLFCLREINQKKGSDAYIAERLKAEWKKIPPKSIEVLSQVQNMPAIQKVIAENLPRT